MKKRYCINVGRCIVLPAIPAIMWSIFLLMILSFTFFGALIKGELSGYFTTVFSGWSLLFFLSGPISLLLSALLSVLLILFPISYVKVDTDSIKVCRALKKRWEVKYDTISYVRLNKRYKTELLLSFVIMCTGCEVNTIEIRSESLSKSFWLSSSRRTYEVIVERLKTVLAGDTCFVERDFYVARPQWIEEFGDPQDNEWSISND